MGEEERGEIHLLRVACSTHSLMPSCSIVSHASIAFTHTVDVVHSIRVHLKHAQSNLVALFASITLAVFA